MEFTEADRELLQAFIEGRYSQEQLVQLKEHMTSEAWRGQLNNYMQHRWNEALATATPASADEAERAWQTLLSRVPALQPAPVKSMRFPHRKRVAVAAAVVLAAAGIMWWQQTPIHPHTTTAMAAERKVWHSQPGKISHLVLPDSSEVYLSGNATLSCNERYGTDNRALQLEGEAYFIANHKCRWPLTVITGSVTTVDIGTEFNIRYYSHLKQVEVAVAQGKVEVQTPATSKAAAATTPLSRQQQLHYDMNTGRYNTSLLPDNETAGNWRKGILLFHKQPLEQVAAVLESYYGVKIRISKPADKALLITTAIEKMSAKEAIDILSMTAGIAYTEQDSTIVFQ